MYRLSLSDWHQRYMFMKPAIHTIILWLHSTCIRCIFASQLPFMLPVRIQHGQPLALLGEDFPPSMKQMLGPGRKSRIIQRNIASLTLVCMVNLFFLGWIWVNGDPFSPFEIHRSFGMAVVNISLSSLDAACPDAAHDWQGLLLFFLGFGLAPLYLGHPPPGPGVAMDSVSLAKRILKE